MDAKNDGNSPTFLPHKLPRSHSVCKPDVWFGRKLLSSL